MSSRPSDPALQFLHKKVRDGHAPGRVHQVTAGSSLYPAASPGFLRTSGWGPTLGSAHSHAPEARVVSPLCSGRILYSVAMHDVDIDVDIVSALPGECAPETTLALGSTSCPGESAAFLSRSSHHRLGCSPSWRPGTGRHSPRPPI